MKKIFIVAIAACAILPAVANDDTKEIMTIELTNGEKMVYAVDDITSMRFVQPTIAFTYTDAEGESESFEAIPQLFRMLPAETGQPTKFGFGPKESTEPAGLLEGKYAVELTLAPSVLYTGEINLAENTESALLTLYVYNENLAVEKSFTSPTGGTLNTSRNAKGEVTLELNATFDDGTAVYASYRGKATDVESLEALNPAPVYYNELLYFNNDGVQSIHRTVTGVKKTTASGKSRYTLEFDRETETTRIEILPELVGTLIFLPDAAENSANFQYGHIQVSSPNDQWRNTATNAFVKVVENEDGTVSIDCDVTNTYKMYGSDNESGTPERVIINYNGELN